MPGSPSSRHCVDSGGRIHISASSEEEEADAGSSDPLVHQKHSTSHAEKATQTAEPSTAIDSGVGRKRPRAVEEGEVG